MTITSMSRCGTGEGLRDIIPASMLNGIVGWLFNPEQDVQPAQWPLFCANHSSIALITMITVYLNYAPMASPNNSNRIICGHIDWFHASSTKISSTDRYKN
jgi:hypothetical protein